MLHSGGSLLHDNLPPEKASKDSLKEHTLLRHMKIVKLDIKVGDTPVLLALRFVLDTVW